MEIIPAVLKALRTQVNREFQTAYEETPTWYQRVSTTINSTTSQNTYAWLAALAGMREWIGPRVINNLITHEYAIVNRTWEDSFGILRDHIEDDNIGIYTNIAQSYGEAARQHPDELMTTLMQTGTSTLCFDGQNFFDTDHPVALKDASLGVYSNNFTSRALTQDNFHTTRETMQTYKNDANRSLKVMPDLLVIPPQLEKEAMEIVQAEKNSNGATNISFRMADILVVPDLSAQATTWYFIATSKRIRPFVFQTRRPIAFAAKDNLDDDNVISNNEFRFYADARYNAGYALPFLASRNIG